jgi:hypothetical protein
MSIEGTIGCVNEHETCVVCGKQLRAGDALAKLHQNGNTLPICCPLCLEAYLQDRELYLTRSARRTVIGALGNPPVVALRSGPLNG